MVLFLAKHKIGIGCIVLILIGGGFLWVKSVKDGEVKQTYVFGSVERGTLLTSISGSGQISVSNQLDLKSKVSSDKIHVLVQDGQTVKNGDVLIKLNDRDAQKAVRDAEVNLKSAKLALEKLKKPADATMVLQSENDLSQARDALEKLKKPADATMVLQSENDLSQAHDALEKLTLSQKTDREKLLESETQAQSNVKKGYDDAFNEIANTFLDLPNIINSLNDILFGTTIAANQKSALPGQWNTSVLLDAIQSFDREKIQALQVTAQTDYKMERSKFDTTFDHYKSSTRYADHLAIDVLLSETLETAKSIAQAAKSESNYLDAWVDYRTQRNLSVFSQVTDFQKNLSTYTGQINSHLSSLLSIRRTLQDNKDAISQSDRDLKKMDQNNPLDSTAAQASIKQKEAALKKIQDGADPLDIAAAQASIKQKEAALKKLKNGADVLDIQSQELLVKQKENALLDVSEKLSDYTITAPFDGIIAKVQVKEGDSLFANAIIGTFITKQRTAQISLNEVDAAKIQGGQKVTLTFDALEGLQITGEVAQIDTIGTVAQGVVTYSIKILFDTQDERVKPGMNVNAAIITQVKQNVLFVSNGALKTQGQVHFVEMADETISETDALKQQGIQLKKKPRRQVVGVGLVNDSSTEIISGLQEGDLVIVRTITSAKSQSNGGQQAPSLFGSPGGGRNNGGGGIRIPR